MSDPFLISKGVRQGCVLSPLLYVLFIEPFVVSIMQDSRIGGLVLGSGGLQCKVVQYADDTTCIVRDYGSLVRLFEVINLFERASGSRLNMNKSQGLVLGTWPESISSVVPVKWTADPIKINGMLVDRGDMALINWNQRVTSILSTLNIKWKDRTLTHLGKVLFVNTGFFAIVLLSPCFT